METVELELPQHVILILATQAHELNITLNQHILNIVLENAEKDIREYKKRDCNTLYEAIEEIGRKKSH